MSLLSKIGKGLGKVVGAVAKGAVRSLPGAGIVGTAIGLVKGGGGGGGSGGPGPPALIPRGIGGPSGFQIPSWVPGVGTIVGGGNKRVSPGPMGECPKGYHLNKSRSSDGLPPRSFCTRNRSMNFANGRSALRAGRRLKGTAKLLRKAIRFTSPNPPKGRPIARTRKGR